MEVVEAAVAEAAAVEFVLECIQVFGLGAGFRRGHLRLSTAFQRGLLSGLLPGLLHCLLPGLQHKLCFRDWIFLGEIKKTAGLAARERRV